MEGTILFNLLGNGVTTNVLLSVLAILLLTLLGACIWLGMLVKRNIGTNHRLYTRSLRDLVSSRELRDEIDGLRIAASYLRETFPQQIAELRALEDSRRDDFNALLQAVIQMRNALFEIERTLKAPIGGEAVTRIDELLGEFGAAMDQLADSEIGSLSQSRIEASPFAL